MATVWIDGVELEVDGSRNMLDVAQTLGLSLPYFCWHPALGSVGACRQCAVKQFKDEDDEQGKIVMACMTPASDGTRISIEDPEAAKFRATVIEWLMVNHPHDCPVCDEGGECHLQDMTVMSGHDYRRYRFNKRTYRNQDLGPFINHEMNRCIQCYRCVRFYGDYAGGHDLREFASQDRVYFGRAEDGPLESEFSGNLVEVCPTGVFTDKSLKRHFTRKWDLGTAPSVCVHCGLGCNTIPGERYGELRRIRARYNGHVNGYFLCDRGRYGYEFVNHERRIRRPLRPEGAERPASSLEIDDAVGQLAERLGDGDRVIGIGSPRASLQSLYALRQAVGPERFYQGVRRREAERVATVLEMLQRGASRTPSLHEVERCDAVLVLGDDPTNTAPMLDLSLRQAARNQPARAAADRGIETWHDAAVREVIQDATGPLFIATAQPTKLDEVAQQTYRGTPEQVARLGYAVAHALDPNAPEVTDPDPELVALADHIADALARAERPLVVTGTEAGSAQVLHAAANAAWALWARGRRGPAELVCTVPECNALGAAMLGGGVLEDALEAAERGEVDTIVIVENDLYRRLDRATVDRLLGAVKHVVVLDHVAHATGAKAELLLPAATFAESHGALVNNEGRAQRFFEVFAPAEPAVRASWKWIRDALRSASRTEARAWDGYDAITAELARAVPSLAPVAGLAPTAEFRVVGEKVPRQPYRYSGRTAMHADRQIREPQPLPDPDSPLANTMEGFAPLAPSTLLPIIHAPGWNSVQAVTRFQEEVNGPLRGGDPGARLIEPAPEAEQRGYYAPEASSESNEGMLRVVPIAFIFGSEELSVMSPGVASRAPAPHVAMAPADAGRLGVETGDTVEVTVGAWTQRLPVRTREGFAEGVLGVPVGLEGVELDAAGWAEVKAP